MSSEWRGFLCVSDIFGGNNNSLLDKAQQITMRNPCSHTWQYYTNIAFVRSRYRSIYNLYRLLTKAISVILLIWLVDQDYFTKWIQRALNVYFFPQIHIACTCEHPWWHHIDHLTFFLIPFPWLLIRNYYLFRKLNIPWDWALQ